MTALFLTSYDIFVYLAFIVTIFRLLIKISKAVKYLKKKTDWAKEPF